MTPFVSDPDFTLYVGDVRRVLARLPAGSIGVELNEAYAALCARRLQQLSLFAEEQTA